MRNKSGFTLVELLIYIGVSTIVLVSVTGLLFSTLSSYTQARAHNTQTIALHDALKIISHLTENAYAIDPSSNLGVNLAAPGRNILFLSATGNVRLFMSQNTLFAERNSQTAALHDSSVPFTSCTVTATTGTVPTAIVSCSSTASLSFGLPDAVATASTTFALQGYAP